MSYAAELYENFMVPGLFAPWSAHLLQIAKPQPGERVLDVACGTGIVARQFARHSGPQGVIIGLDIDPNKIEVARLMAAREGLAIEWKTGPAERLPFPDASFDLLICQFGLMFFSDRHAALMEMHRVLKTNGRVVLSAWQGLDRHPFYQTLDNVSRRRLGKSSVGAVFSLGDADEIRTLLTNAGFEDVAIESMSITARYSNPQEFLAWEIDVDPAETPALKNLDAEAQKAILKSLHEEMQAPLQDVTKDNEVVLPSHAHIAHARR